MPEGARVARVYVRARVRAVYVCLCVCVCARKATAFRKLRRRTPWCFTAHGHVCRPGLAASNETAGAGTRIGAGCSLISRWCGGHTG